MTIELYIRIKDGQPFEHPIFGDNFRQAFPDVDVNNLPPEFARFVRVERPELGVYEVFDPIDPTYELIDGVWTDAWHTREMTVEEKAAKQQSVRDAFNARPQAENWSAWTLDETTCTMQPPTPRPNDGKTYFWQGTTLSWVERPPYPDDGKTYKLDFASATWVEVTP